MSDNSSATDIRSLLEDKITDEVLDGSVTEVSTPEAPAQVEAAPEASTPEVETAPAEVTSEATPEASQTEEKPQVEAKEKAPQSWKPALREKWKELPPEVRAEIDRREKDIQTTLQSTAQERKIASEFADVIRPYEAMLVSEGHTPTTAVKGLLNSAYVLRTGAPEIKAKMLASFFQTYQVDPALVGQYLYGNTPQVDPQTSALQQKIAHLEAQFSQVAQAPVIQQQQAIEKQITDFTSDPKNEFVGDVMSHMVALINAGAASTLQDAYDQACYANPEVRKILTNRQVSVSTKKAASSSVAGSPRSTIPANKANGSKLSIAESIRAAIGDPRSRV